MCLDGGGELTHYMTGNESKPEDQRPSTEPMFSRGNYAEFPTLVKYCKTNYVDFIRFHTYNNQQTLISQSVHDNNMFAIFGHHKKYNTRKKQFWVSSSFKEVKEQVKIHSKAGMNIFSLAADQETGKFYVYMMEDFCKAQSIMQTEDPEDLFLSGLSVTSVTCLNKKYIFVVTAGASQYENKEQVIFTKSNRSDLDTEIKKQRSEGKVITSFCINHELSEYLVVMTEMEGCEQASGWFNIRINDGSRERNKWAEPHVRRNLLYAIACEDFSDHQTFYIMTSDEDRNGSLLRGTSFFS